jgi:hypothetical protein
VCCFPFRALRACSSCPEERRGGPLPLLLLLLLTDVSRTAQPRAIHAAPLMHPLLVYLLCALLLSSLSVVLWCCASLWVRGAVLLFLVSAAVHALVAKAFHERDKAHRWTLFEQYVEREKKKKKQQAPQSPQSQQSQPPTAGSDSESSASDSAAAGRRAATATHRHQEAAAAQSSRRTNGPASASEPEQSEPPSPDAAPTSKRRTEIQKGFVIF